jgi:hypothetical protein
LKEGRRHAGNRARVSAGVSTFIPKPQTPFQWVSCDAVESIQAKQNLLRNTLRGSGFKLTWTDPTITLHEAWLSRGDRRTAQVIHRAWQLGSKFDAWQEGFKADLWLQAFAECGLEPDFYSHRQRALDEVLPWQHISTGVRIKHLQEEYRRSKAGETRGDCREACYACGILPGFNELRASLPDDAWKCPQVKRAKARRAASAAGARTTGGKKIEGGQASGGQESASAQETVLSGGAQ